MNTAEISPATRTEVDLAWEEEVENLWYRQKDSDRDDILKKYHEACVHYMITALEARAIFKEIARERMGEVEFLPRPHFVLARLTKALDRPKTGPWDKWREIPECPFCIDGWTYAARYEEGVLKGGNHVWCQCEKGVQHPLYNAYPMKKWKDVEKIAKLIPKDSQEFMDDMLPILQSYTAQEWLKGYGKYDRKDLLGAMVKGESLVPF